MTRSKSIYISRNALKAELRLRKKQFQDLAEQGVVHGDFEAGSWLYNGDTLNFWRKRSNRDAKVPLDGAANDIARSYAIACIARGESSTTVRGKIAPIRWLVEEIGDAVMPWVEISPPILDRCVAKISKAMAPTGAYHRASCLGQLVDYLNQIVHRCQGAYVGFLARRIKWHPRLKNPIHSTLDRMGLEGKKHSEKHFKPDLHLALGSARAMIKSDLSLEPTPGHDLIRLEALSFAMALGIRVGEVCSLPLNAYDVEETTGVPIVRIIAEKGALPAARPVESVWAPLLSEAYGYLLETCAAARARAKQIERSGFRFIIDELRAARTKRPLSAIDELRMNLGGHPIEQYFLVSEVVRVFDITPNELTTTGRGLPVTEKTLSAPEARLISWMDERVARCDWYKMARRYKGTGVRPAGDADLRISRLAKLTGAGKKSLLEHPCRYDLEQLLLEVQKGRLLESGALVSDAVRREIASRWNAIRKRSLEHRTDRVVDVAAWSKMLEQRYLGYLSRHFRENFYVSNDGSPKPVGAHRLSTIRTPDARLSKQLIVLWDQQFSGFKNKGVIPRPMMRHDLYNYMCGDSIKETIFKRLNIRDKSGSHVAIAPHDIRHWVTTAKMRSGSSQMMVDLWMGRKPGQSRHYDHRSAAERAESVRKVYSSKDPPNDYLGRKVNFWRDSNISEDEIALMISSKLRVAHFVPWGMCSRELYVTPCTRGLMCLRGFGTKSACESFHVDPHDLEAKKNIELLMDKYLVMLRQIEPNFDRLQSTIADELNDTSPLDQHIQFMLDVVRGCSAALSGYSLPSSQD